MAIRRELLLQIGAIPPDIVVQADEYLFTVAAVMARVQILPDALTYYRLHDLNGFQLSGNDPQRARRKQAALAALAVGLSQRLNAMNMDPLARKELLDMAWANANQLRLRIDGGWPWETFKTEWKIYDVRHPEAPFSHRVFKSLTLLAGLLVPPKLFYAAQTKLSQSSLYQRARQRILPVPQMAHLERDWPSSPTKLQ
jgi:hypothetical protein